MENLIGYIATGSISLTVGILLIYFQPKSKVFYWFPHSFFFDITDQKVQLQTDSITIQNLGRKSAKNLIVVFDRKPDFYQLQPTIVHESIDIDNGGFAVKINELGPKEFYTFQILSHTKLPRLLNVRSDSGQAKEIPFQLRRIYPTWVNSLIYLFLAIGISTSVYWVTVLIFKLHYIFNSVPP